MHTSIITAAVAAVVACLLGAGAAMQSPFDSCSGRSAYYNITFTNLMTPRRFGNLIPATGLNFSPMTATSHSNRYSVLTVRGFASRAVEDVAETGDNSRLVTMLTRRRDNGNGVLSVQAAPGGTGPGMSITLTVKVDCEHPFVSALSMIAPSPDWVVQINNVNVWSAARGGRWVWRRRGTLIAYDAGTDDGREFTAPSDLSLDLPTRPAQNIAPLVEDETDRFRGRFVGRYIVQRIRMN